MSDFDIVREISKITDMNSMFDYVIIGAVVATIGYIAFQIMSGAVPGIFGLILPGVAGAILGAMLYIFASGTA